MAFERYRLPTLIGQSRMGKVIAAAAAAMALAPFLVLAATPGAADDAIPWLPHSNLRPDTRPATASEMAVQLGCPAKSASDSGAVRGVLDGPAPGNQLVP